MTESVPRESPPTWRRVLARRRYRVLLALVLLAIVVRAALPAVIRRVVVAEADKAMIGHIEIDDVDLALYTAGFTLHGLRVFASEASPSDASPSSGVSPSTDASPPTNAGPPADASPSSNASPPRDAPPATDETSPRAGEGAPGSAPVLSAGTLTVDLGFRALLRKTVEVQRIELADVAVSLDRAKDGTLVLPAAVPSTEPAPPSEGSGWGVLIQSVALRDGRIGFRDFAIGDPPQHVEVALPTLDAGKLALLITESGVEPGKVSLDAGIQDGTLHLEATLESLPGGPAYESHVVLTNVPIADSRLYIPKVGWSGLTGRLDADLVHRFESLGAHTVRGTAGLRDLEVRVAGLDDPALAWRGLTIDVAGVDFVAHHAAITTVGLDGARVVTRPAGPEPLPVLRGLFAAAAEKVGAAAPAPTVVGGPSPAAPTAIASPVASVAPTSAATPMADTPATSAPASAPAGSTVSATVDAASPKPWTWAVDQVRVSDASVRAIGGDGPLDLAVTATVAPLGSAKGTPATVHLTLASSGGGTLDLSGALTPAPLAFDGTLDAKDLRLPPLTQPVATAATRLLKSGVANFHLAVAAGASSRAPTDGVRISGDLALADIDVAGEDPTAFALRWKQLALGLRDVSAPGILGAGGGASPGPIDAAFTSIALARPEIIVTRTAEGLALPAALRGEPAAAGAPAPSPKPAATTATAPRSGPDVHVRVDRLTLDHMRLATNDTVVKPYYRTTLDPIDFSAANVDWPGPTAQDVKLTAKNVDGGVLTVTGNVAPTRTRLVAKLAELPLAPFNPYAAGTGYGVAAGTAQLDSTIVLNNGAYDTKSRLTLHGLDVRGGEGDALFAQKFGMPLALALSLLTDLQGNIVIDLPITGDASGMRTGLGTLIGNALTRAILNAVTSPLKLIGAVAHIGDKPAALTPQPIAFAAGRAEMAAGEEQKLAPLASLLARAPGVRLHLRGTAGDDDRRWLREQALRLKLEQESGGFGAIRHLGERGPRRDVLAALTARAAGTPAEIPAEHQAWFEAQVAAQSVDDAALKQLATARATAVGAKLASGQGVDAARIVVDDAAIEPTARPAVVIGLAGR